MNNYSVDNILALALSYKENTHESRARLGRHVFLSRYFLEFRGLTEEEKLALVPHENNEDDASIDSVDTPPVRRIKVWQVMRVAQARWREELSREIQQAWELRAGALNARPIPGRFPIVPNEVGFPTVDSNVIACMYKDWRNVVSEMKNGVIRAPRAGRGLKTYKFGPETVSLHNQKFKEGYIPSMVGLALFGYNMHNLKTTEVIRAENKSYLIHINSLRRVREIFNVEGLSSVSYERENRIHSCCGKVST